MNKYIKLDYLSNKMYINRTSLSKDMNEVRKIIGRYNLKIINKPNYGIVVSGHEFGKRICMIDSYLYFDEDKFDESDYEKYTKIDKNTYDLINTLVSNIIRELNVSMPLMGRQKLILYFIIQFNRIKNGYLLTNKNFYQIDKMFNNKVDGLIREFYKLSLSAEISNVELCSVYALVFAYMNLNENYRGRFNLFETFGCGEAAESLIDYITDQINISHESIFSELKMMLVQIYFRVKVGIINYDFNLGPTKRKGYISYIMSVMAVDYIQNKLGMTINENEIVHLIGIFDKTVNINAQKFKKKDVLLISSIRGIGISYLIKSMIKQYITDYDVTVDIEDIDKLESINKKYDCIVADCPMDAIKRQEPAIYVNKMFDDHEMKKMRRIFIDERQKLKYINNLFNPGIYYKDVDFNTKEEVLKFLFNELYNKNLVSYNYYNELIERENINSSETENDIAFPCSIKAYNKNTFATVIILNKPILWNKEVVKIILDFQIGSDEPAENIIFLNRFIKDFSSDKNITALLKKDDYKHFINICNEVVRDTSV